MGTTIESCLLEGKPLLLENVDRPLQSSLDSLLESINEGCNPIMYDDKEIEIAKGFTLILATRLSNPELHPEMFAKVNVINFTVSSSGLEDQFLSFIVDREKPSLQKERVKLETEVQECKNKIQQLEKDLLLRLSSSTGDILDDDKLISVLANTKDISKEVLKRLDEASVTRKTILKLCEEYRQAACRAANLYFLLSDFSLVNAMYKVCFIFNLKSVIGSTNTVFPRSADFTGELYRPL